MFQFIVAMNKWVLFMFYAKLENGVICETAE